MTFHNINNNLRLAFKLVEFIFSAVLNIYAKLLVKLLFYKWEYFFKSLIKKLIIGYKGHERQPKNQIY